MWKVTFENTTEKDKVFKTVKYELFIDYEKVLEIINNYWKGEAINELSQNKTK